MIKFAIGAYRRCLKALYAVMKLRRPKRKVVFYSRQGKKPGLDFRLLVEELKEMEDPPKIKVICKHIGKDASSVLSSVGVTLAQMFHMANAKMVVLDSYCIPVSLLDHRPELKVMQIWHALGAIKKFGWQTVGKAGGTSELIAEEMKMHRGYHMVACSSDATAPFFCEAFGCSRDKVVKLGLPRIDEIVRQVPETGENIRAAYEIPEHKKVILYAPTFRKDVPVDPRPLIDAIDKDKYTLIVKRHPLDPDYGIEEDVEGVIDEVWFRTYDLLKAADIIISDYSSFVIEAGLTGKPLYLYTYDLEEYKASTGLNVEYADEAIGKYQFADPQELAESMEEPYDTEALDSFCSKFVDVDTKDCTRKMAEFIMEQIDGKPQDGAPDRNSGIQM